MRLLIKQYLIFLALLIVCLALPQVAWAATAAKKTGILSSLQIFGANMGLPATDPRLIIARLIRSAMGIVGIILLLMILKSGFTLMTSGGDEEKVHHAKRTFFNAIIGIVIMLSAYSIVAFVLRALSGASG